MRKSRIVLVVLICLILLEVVGAGALVLHILHGAEADQAAVYAQYTALLDSGERSVLTVTEDGKTIGTYTLAGLGLWADFQTAAEGRFSRTDRMEPEAFAALPIREKLNWDRESHPGVSSLPVNTAHLNAEAVLRDLSQEIRPKAQSAYAYFDGTAFQICPEVPGRVLNQDAVLDALNARAAAMTVSAGQPAAVTLELTDFDCYVPPEITAETGVFDFSAMLADALSRTAVTLNYHGTAESLSKETLAALVRVDADGQLSVQADALDDFLARCAEGHRETNKPFILNSYATGPVTIDFLTCDYLVDTEALGEALTEALLKLENAEIEVPYVCTDGVDKDGKPFSLGDTYVEVDIAKQQMTFYKDGELIVHTDVVTGFRNWRETPTGFYTVQNKDTGCWLSGPDFNVYVEYWVGFIGTLYGLHDASWRDEFGGMIYAKNGSHGCVNTPSDAMQLIYENIDLGAPVLIYDVKRDA